MLKFVAGKAGKPNRDLHLELDNLMPGTYYLFVEVDWAYSQREFVVTSYGEGTVKFLGDEASRYDKMGVLRDIFKSKAVQEGPSVQKADMGRYNAPGIVKYADVSYLSQFGYAYFYYVNREKTLTFEENLVFTQFRGAKLVQPFAGTAATVKVAPRQE